MWVYKVIQAKTIDNLILCDYFWEPEHLPSISELIQVPCHKCGTIIEKKSGYKIYTCDPCKKKNALRHKELQKQKYRRQQYEKVFKGSITIPPSLRDHAIYQKGYWYLNKTGMKKLKELQNHDTHTTREGEESNK